MIFWAFVPLKMAFGRLSGQIDVYLRSSPVRLWIFKTLSKDEWPGEEFTYPPDINLT